MNGQSSASCVLVVFSQTVQVQNFFIKGNFPIEQNGFNKYFSEVDHLVVGVFGKDFIDFGKVDFKGFGIREGLID